MQAARSVASLASAVACGWRGDRVLRRPLTRGFPPVMQKKVILRRSQEYKGANPTCPVYAAAARRRLRCQTWRGVTDDSGTITTFRRPMVSLISPGLGPRPRCSGGWVCTCTQSRLRRRQAALLAVQGSVAVHASHFSRGSTPSQGNLQLNSNRSGPSAWPAMPRGTGPRDGQVPHKAGRTAMRPCPVGVARKEV